MAKWLVLLSMCLITVMLAIDATALNIALPVIATEFYTSLTDLQWVINAFFLLAAMVQILGGHLGDSYGHKKIFLITIVLFIISSLGAGFSVNEKMLIACRALQGASIGIISPLSIVLIFDCFPKEQQSFARSFIVTAMGVALAGGAPLGALFVHTIGWRWIFYINIPIGIFCYFLTKVYCVSKTPTERKPIDYKSISVLILALFSIAFALNQVQNWGFISPLFIGFILAGLILFYLLYRYESKQADPIIDFKLFYRRNFILNNTLRLIGQFVFVSILFFIPLYVQNVTGRSPLVTGMLMLAFTVIMALISPFAGKWVDFGGGKAANILSMILFMISSLFFLLIHGQLNFWILSIALLLSGSAIAIMIVSTMTGALADAPEKKMGVATAIYFTVAWISCAIGVAISGTAIAMKSSSVLHQQLQQQEITLTSSQLELAQRVSKGISSVSELQNPQLQEITSSSFVAGLHTSTAIFGSLCVLGLILSFFLASDKRRQSTQA